MGPRHLVAVDAEILGDLLALADRLLSNVIEEPMRDVAHIRDVPMAVVDGIRGSVAEVRIHSRTLASA